MKRLLLLVLTIWVGSVLAYNAMSYAQTCFSCYFTECGVPICTWVFDFGKTGCSHIPCISCTESGAPCGIGGATYPVFQIDDEKILQVANQNPRYAAVLALARGMAYSEDRPIKMYLTPLDISSEDIKYFLHPKKKESEEYFGKLREQEKKISQENVKPIIFHVRPTKTTVKVISVSNTPIGELPSLMVSLDKSKPASLDHIGGSLIRN